MSAGPEDSLKDFKTQLQELLQKKGHMNYLNMNLLRQRVQDHNAVFYVSCYCKRI